MNDANILVFCSGTKKESDLSLPLHGEGLFITCVVKVARFLCHMLDHHLGF
jgi:hypothetical protein